MRIRSLTAFTEVFYPLEAGATANLGEALREARAALTSGGLEVQTTRLATQPFPDVLGEAGPGKLADLAQDIEAMAFVHEVDFVSLGPARIEDAVAFIEAMPAIFRNTENVFASVEIATRAAGLHLGRIRRAAELIRRVSAIREDGFANLRLAALANVGPGSPFFPAAYHSGGAPQIAVATEAADVVTRAISSATSLDDAHEALVRTVEAEAERVEALVKRGLDGTGVGFGGIDFSLAPHPEEGRSIGAALEALGLPAMGAQGTLGAAAFVAAALGEARFKRAGFCGIMLPVLEDRVLAERAAEGRLTIDDLLMASAVCGTGLDTIPLPGTITQDQLVAILFDVAALALRLDKPLTARLMPLPGRQAGDETDFEFEYFANSRVLPAPESGLSGLLAGEGPAWIAPLKARG
jgi:uncharacterized protein (UPF0210 family)